MSYALKFAVIGLAFLIIGVLGIVIFDAIWAGSESARRS